MSERKRRFSRRGFLSKAAAAVAAPYVVPAAVLGQRSSRNGEQTVPPSERVGVAFLGSGQRGYQWVSYLSRMPQVRCVGVCDVSDRAIELGLRYANRREQGCKPYKDFREVLDLKDVDAVLIATPDHWHGVLAVQAAKAGKDVFCESPMSLTVREAQEIARVAQRYGRVFQAGTDRRSNANLATACEIIRGQQLGEIKEVYVQAGPPSRHCHLSSGESPGSLNWDMWLGPAPEAPYHPYRVSGQSSFTYGWRAWRDYCGGQLASHGSHYFDMIHWALGLDETGPVEVLPGEPRASEHSHQPVGKNQKVLTVRYANGLTVHNAKGPKGALVEFVGSVGTLGVGLGEKDFQTWPEEIGMAAMKEAQASGQRRSSSSGRYYAASNHAADWIDCVRTRKKCVSDAETARRSVTVCHLGCIATWLGRAIRWDPVKEEIVGDAEASRWLDRPRRAPWRV